MLAKLDTAIQSINRRKSILSKAMLSLCSVGVAGSIYWADRCTDNEQDRWLVIVGIAAVILALQILRQFAEWVLDFKFIKLAYEEILIQVSLNLPSGKISPSLNRARFGRYALFKASTIITEAKPISTVLLTILFLSLSYLIFTLIPLALFLYWRYGSASELADLEQKMLDESGDNDQLRAIFNATTEGQFNESLSKFVASRSEVSRAS